MIQKIKPVRLLKGKIDLPASKSYSIRAFIIAACGGRSCIINPSDCDDALVAKSVAQQLGATVNRRGERAWQLTVKQGTKKNLPARINVKESGTVLRFLLPLVALKGKKSRVTGEGTLRNRPNLYLTRVLRSCGVKVKGRGPKECVPVFFKGGEFLPGRIAIDGTLSSQFISALLISCPQLNADSKIIVQGRRMVSTDYITMTEKILRLTGVKVAKLNQRTFKIRGGQEFRGLGNFKVPADFGLAAFPLAAAALVDSRIRLKGHLIESLNQADGAIFPLLKKMGVRFKKTKTAINIRGPFALKGGVYSLKDCPDLVPIMAILALFAKGQTRLVNIQHVRTKESDRISDLRRELLKIGAKVKEDRNSLTILPQKKYKSNILLNPHQDHRLAMAFSILGLKVGVRVKDRECVRKSYPGFFHDLRKIGVSFR